MRPRYMIPLLLLGAFLLMQLVPYRITNPPVTAEPKWDSPQTRALAVRACYNCHSNQTKKPIYTKIAPISWWTAHHVDEGRSALNFSEWKSPQRVDEIGESIREGSMPPGNYTWFGLHSDSKLTPAEKQQLITGLEKTIQNDPPPAAKEGGEGDKG